MQKYRKNQQPPIKNTAIYDLPKAVFESFDWKDTEEGYHYWHDVYSTICEKRRVLMAYGSL